MKFLFSLIFAVLCPALQAQQRYAVNDLTGDFAISKILNHSPASSSFRQLKDRLLIVDFFGTWCVPCIRAIPKLSELQGKYKNEIRILLVSEEPAIKLENFISKQTRFDLPVVVDLEGNFTRAFQPPSYPYTVIVGKNGRVIAIPSPDEMTEANIDKWMKEQTDSVVPPIEMINNTQPLQVPAKTGIEFSGNKLVQLSQDFMYAAKTGEEITVYITTLKDLDLAEIQSGVKTDNDKKAFWINLYNAYTQVILKNDPGKYERRSKFFGSRDITIAGKQFSLDEIEHGILRRSKIKWSLGHLSKLFQGKTEKVLRVDKLDYRLHFALNCGAKSCPPIAFYKPETIDQQLDLATKAYLRSEVEYDESANSVKLPALMSWFRRDFGGKKGMIQLLRKLSIIPPAATPRIKFKDYDWSLYLQNYKS